MKKLELTETTARKNWPAWRIPEWADQGARLYTGFKVSAAARDWTEIVTVCEDGITTAYLTAAGFDTKRHGPAIATAKGKAAQHRKVVRQWFREYCGVEVSFV